MRSEKSVSDFLFLSFGRKEKNYIYIYIYIYQLAYFQSIGSDCLSAFLQSMKFLDVGFFLPAYRSIKTSLD